MSALQIPFRTPPIGSPAANTHPFPPFEPAATDAQPSEREQPPRLIESTGSARHNVEALIQARFATAYDAHIARFMPRLFSLQREAGTTLGAFGLREAALQPLFLERYLEQPIETAIGRAIGQPVSRGTIVEVGQFAGSGAGAFRTLILRLTERLHEEGHRWVVFTGTTALRNAFARLGLAPQELGPADPTRLSADEQAAWGSYYQHGPRVMFGDIREGFDTIAARLARGSAA